MVTKHTNIQTKPILGSNKSEFLMILHRDLSCRSVVCPKKIGEGSAKILETSVLSVATIYHLVWTRHNIDLQDLAIKRWVERLNMEELAAHFNCGRTVIIRKIGYLRKNPDLIQDGLARSHAKSRKYRFMGKSVSF